MLIYIVIYIYIVYLDQGWLFDPYVSGCWHPYPSSFFMKRDSRDIKRLPSTSNGCPVWRPVSKGALSGGL